MKRITFLIGFLLFVSIIFSANFHDVLINEFNTEVSWGTLMGGVDGSVELKNTTGSNIDLSSWSIEFLISLTAYGDPNTQSMSLSGTLNANSILLLSSVEDSVYGGSIREGGGFIILKDGSGNIIDSVYYGTMGKAPDPGVDTSSITNPYSCERVATTGNDAYDWEWQEHPTWGVANSHTQQPLLGQDIVINEVYLKSGDATSFIELFNISSGTVDISNWRILVDVLNNTIPASTTIAPGGFYVITDNFSQYEEGSGETSFDTSTLYLIDNNGQRHDQFGWENLSASGEDFSRVMDGTGGNYDGYNRATCGFTEGLPQTKSDYNVPPDAIRLTELELKTDKTFAVELHNTWTYSIDLGGFTLNGSPIKSGTIIDTYLVLSSSDFDTSLETVINTGAGTIEFKNSFGNPLDSFSYGYQGAAPDFIAGYSLAKIQNTGSDANDWTIDFTPTIGSANDAPIPTLTGGVVINEVNPHFGSSFIELYNNTGGSIDISGYQIGVADFFTIPASTIMDSGSYYVIEESSYPANFNLTSIDSQNHNNVYLFDNTGVRIDQIGWETVCSFGSNSLQRDDAHPSSWSYDGYDMFTSGLTCDDDSKGFYNVPHCSNDATPPDWTVSGVSNINAQSDYYRIQLSWDAATDPENPVYYTVYKAINDTSTFNPIAQDVTANTYLDTSVNVGTTYYYKIETYNCFGLAQMATDISYASPTAYTLKDIRQNDANEVPLLNNVNVSDVEGYVNVQSGILQPTKFSIYIQKNGYGVNVFGYNPASPIDKYKVGDLVKVSGQVTFYNGTTEIKIGSDSDITLVSSGNTVTPEITPVAGTNWEEKEGVLVTVEGEITYMGASGSNHFIYIKSIDLNNNPFAPSSEIEFYWNSSFDNINIDTTGMSVGSKVQVTGIVAQYDKTSPYDSYYEIKPRFQSDVKILQPAPLKFEKEGLTKSVIYPQSGETTSIQYNATENSSVVIRIYDIKGLIQKTLFDGISASAKVPYDGTNDNGNYLNPGVYIVNIVVKNGKTVESKNFPLVIAIPLNK